MELRTEAGRHPAIATRAELERALLTWGDAEDAFAVLSRADGHFVQAAGTRASGFVAEHGAGDGMTMPSARRDLSKGDVLALFGAFLEGQDWRGRISWDAGEERAVERARARNGGLLFPRLHGFLAVLVGLALLAAGLALLRKTDAILAHLGTVRGALSSVRVEHEKKGREVTRARVEYAVDGQAYVLEGQVVPARARVGDPITVFYDRTAPERGQTGSPLDRRTLARGLAAVGGLFLLLGVGSLAVKRRGRRGRPPAPPPDLSAPAA